MHELKHSVYRSFFKRYEIHILIYCEIVKLLAFSSSSSHFSCLSLSAQGVLSCMSELRRVCMLCVSVVYWKITESSREPGKESKKQNVAVAPHNENCLVMLFNLLTQLFSAAFRSAHVTKISFLFSFYFYCKNISGARERGKQQMSGGNKGKRGEEGSWTSERDRENSLKHKVEFD